MKKLTQKSKFFLTLIYAVSVVYGVITFIFNIMTHNESIHYTLMGLILLVNIFLIFRVYNFNSLEKETKVLWYFVLVFFGLSGLYYIWKSDDKFFEREIKFRENS